MRELCGHKQSSWTQTLAGWLWSGWGLVWQCPIVILISRINLWSFFPSFPSPPSALCLVQFDHFSRMLTCIPNVCEHRQALLVLLAPVPDPAAQGNQASAWVGRAPVPLGCPGTAEEGSWPWHCPAGALAFPAAEN